MPLDDIQYEDIAWLNAMKIAASHGKTPADRERLAAWNARIERVLSALADAVSIITKRETWACVPQDRKSVV